MMMLKVNDVDDDDWRWLMLMIQDLLQLQYEGVAIMKMFDRAQVNVNLLIFLLNRKFFGKKWEMHRLVIYMH